MRAGVDLHYEEQRMKLSAALVTRTLDQFEAKALPDDHPAVPQLNNVFGDHTYFLNGNGLHVVEPAGAESGPKGEGKVVKVASWANAERTSLSPHRPEPTDVSISLHPDAGNTD